MFGIDSHIFCDCIFIMRNIMVYSKNIKHLTTNESALVAAFVVKCLAFMDATWIESLLLINNLIDHFIHIDWSIIVVICLLLPPQPTFSLITRRYDIHCMFKFRNCILQLSAPLPLYIYSTMFHITEALSPSQYNMVFMYG